MTSCRARRSRGAASGRRPSGNKSPATAELEMGEETVLMLDTHAKQRSNLPKANVSLNKYESDIWKFFRSKASIAPEGLPR